MLVGTMRRRRVRGGRRKGEEKEKEKEKEGRENRRSPLDVMDQEHVPE